MSYIVKVRFDRQIDIKSKDLEVKVWDGSGYLGTLRLSQGGPDWRPSNKHRGKSGEIQICDKLDHSKYCWLNVRATQPDRRPRTSVRNPASRPPSTMSVWPVMYLL
jgi:hypothetical protein